MFLPINQAKHEYVALLFAGPPLCVSTSKWAIREPIRHIYVGPHRVVIFTWRIFPTYVVLAGASYYVLRRNRWFNSVIFIDSLKAVFALFIAPNNS